MDARERELERSAAGGDAQAALRRGIATCRLEGHEYRVAGAYPHPYLGDQFIEVAYCARCLDARTVTKPCNIEGPRNCGGAIFDCYPPRAGVTMTGHMAGSALFARRLVSLVWEDIGHMPNGLRWVVPASLCGLLEYTRGYVAPDVGPGRYAGLPLYLRPEDDHRDTAYLCVGPHEVARMTFINH